MAFRLLMNTYECEGMEYVGCNPGNQVGSDVEILIHSWWETARKNPSVSLNFPHL